MKASEKFNDNIVLGKYRYYDAGHPLKFFVGLDEQNRKTMVLINPAKPDNIKRTSAIDVETVKTSDNNYRLSFHLNDNSMEGIFFKFCDDLVESTRSVFDEAVGMTLVCKRYNLWKKLFYKLNKTTLTENQQMGLIGELLFLKDDLLKAYDSHEAISSWSGCDKTHKDFSIGDDWYEIKTSEVNQLTIKISSLEQLDADKDGTLVVYEFEKMSEEYNGLTLNTVVSEVLSQVDIDDEDYVLEKLKAAGYEVSEEYDKLCEEYEAGKLSDEQASSYLYRLKSMSKNPEEIESSDIVDLGLSVNGSRLELHIQEIALKEAEYEKTVKKYEAQSKLMSNYEKQEAKTEFNKQFATYRFNRSKAYKAAICDNRRIVSIIIMMVVIAILLGTLLRLSGTGVWVSFLSSVATLLPGLIWYLLKKESVVNAFRYCFYRTAKIEIKRNIISELLENTKRPSFIGILAGIKERNGRNDAEEK